MNRIEKEFYVKKKKRKTDPVLLVEISINICMKNILL